MRQYIYPIPDKLHDRACEFTIFICLILPPGTPTLTTLGAFPLI